MSEKPLPLYPPNNLKLIRESKDWTQQGVADELEISKPTVSRHESSERKIKPIYMKAYCGLLKVASENVFDVSKKYTKRLERKVAKLKKAKLKKAMAALAALAALVEKTEKTE